MKKIIIIVLLLCFGVQAKSQDDCDKPYGLYGLIGSDGKVITPPSYTYLEANEAGPFYAKALLNGKYGLLDSIGTVVLPFSYDDIDIYPSYDSFADKTLLPVKSNGKWGFLDPADFKEIVPCKYDHCGIFDFNKALVQNGEYYGAIDNRGKEIVPCVYDDMEDFLGNFTSVTKNGKQGAIFRSGKIVVPISNQEIKIASTNKGIATVEVEEKSGDAYKYEIVDSVGTILVPPVYDYIGYFQGKGQNLAVIKANAKYGFVNRLGQVLIPAIYDEAETFSEGGGYGYKDGIYTYVDSTGTTKLTSSQKLSGLDFFIATEHAKQSTEKRNAFLVNEKNRQDSLRTSYRRLYYNHKLGLYGYKNGNDSLVIPYQYQQAELFLIGNCALVKKDGKYGIINRQNEAVIPIKYNGVDILSPNRCILKKGRKIAFADLQGNLLTDFKYSEVKSLMGHLFRVTAGGHCGICNEDGKELIPCELDKPDDFNFYLWNDGFVKVRKNGKYGVVSDEGKQVLPCNYDQIDDRLSGGKNIVAIQNGKWGIFDKQGTEIVPCMYEKIDVLNKSGVIIEKLNGKWGLADKDKIIIPFEYDRIRDYRNKILIVAKNFSDDWHRRCGGN